MNSAEDWLALGRDLIARGPGTPLMVVAAGAPGLIRAVEQCWPASDRSAPPSTACASCSPRERVRLAYWHASTRPPARRDGTQRLQVLAGELESAGYTAAKCLASSV